MPAAPARPAREEERRLLAAARRGDRAALERLVGILAPPVYRFGHSFCRDRDDAEDIMQETLVTMVRRLGAFRGESSLSTWAFVVARNACSRLRRRRRREAQVVGALAREEPSSPHGPDHALERRSVGMSIASALRELPGPWREVVLLRDIEGLSAADAARALGIRQTALKSRLHRAREALRSALEREHASRRAASADEPPASRTAAARGTACPDLPAMLSRYLEGELSTTVCAELAEHVRGCRSCGPACDELLASLARCRRARGEKPPLRVRQAVRAALREALRSTAA